MYMYMLKILIHLPDSVEITHKVIIINKLIIITNWYVLAKLCLPTLQSTLVVHWVLLLQGKPCYLNLLILSKDIYPVVLNLVALFIS